MIVIDTEIVSILRFTHLGKEAELGIMSTLSLLVPLWFIYQGKRKASDK